MRSDHEPVVAFEIFPDIVVEQLHLLVVQVDVDLCPVPDGGSERVEKNLLQIAQLVEKQENPLLAVGFRGRYEIPYASGGIHRALVTQL